MKNRNAFIIITLVLSVFTSCKNEKVKDKVVLDKISIGILAWPGCGIAYVAEELGYFKEEYLEVNIQYIESFDSRRSALIDDRIDIDYTTIDQLLIYQENGIDVEAFWAGDFSTGGDGIVAKKEINSIADLKGKKIAVAEASPSDFFLKYLLNKAGIKDSEVNIVPAADPQIAGNTIMAKKADAAVTFEPFLSQAAEDEALKILVSTKEYPFLIPGLMVAKNSNITGKKDVFVRLTNAWNKGVEYCDANPAECAKLMAKHIELSEEDIIAIMTTIDLVDKKENKAYFDKALENNIYELGNSISSFWKENNYIKKEFKAEDFINGEIETLISK